MKTTLKAVMGVILLLCGSAFAQVAHYSFEGNADNIVSDDNHGTVFGSSVGGSFVEGVINQGLEFDGIDDCVAMDLSSFPADLNTGSISLWFKVDDLVGGCALLTKSNFTVHRDFCWLSVSPDGGIVYATKYNYTAETGARRTAAGLVLPNQWYHFVITADGVNIVRFFLNGEEVETHPHINDSEETFFEKGSTWAIGKLFRIEENPGSYYFDGVMDEVQFYDEALSESRIQELYCEGAQQPGQAGFFYHVTDVHAAGGADNKWWTEFLCIANGNDKPAFVVVTGDLVERGWDDFSTPATDNWNALTGQLTGTSPLFFIDELQEIPAFFCPGNHDAKGPLAIDYPGFGAYEENIGPHPTFTGLAEHNLAVFSLNGGIDAFTVPPVIPGAPGWWISFLTPPEGTGLDDQNIEMLEEGLSQYGCDWGKIVLMHHPFVNPLGSFGIMDGCIWNNRSEFLDACQDHRVDVVLSGHIHKDADSEPTDVICDEQGERWQEGDDTRFVVTGALKEYAYRKINFDAYGKISEVHPTTQFRDVVVCKINCLTEVHVYDNEGNHLGPNSSGEVDFEIPGAYYSRQVYYDSDSATQESLTELTLLNHSEVSYTIITNCLNDTPMHFDLGSRTVDGPWARIAFTDISVDSGSTAKLIIEKGAVDCLLEVEDPDGTTRTFAPDIRTGNQPPVLFTTPAGPDTTFVSEVDTFSAAATDPENDQMEFRFDWGDGSQSNWIVPSGGSGVCQVAHEWTESGTYEVRVRAKDIWGNMGVWSDPFEVVVLPDHGILSGSVVCGNQNLTGVPIDVLNSEGELYASLFSDQNGDYSVSDVPNDLYTLSIVSPLGYQAVAEVQQVQIAGLEHTVDFELTQLDITPQQRSRGYWVHQLHKALQNKPQDYTFEDFSGFADLINQHFNQNELNPVDFYSVPQPATQADSLDALADLLHMRNTGDWEPFLKRLAKAQLMALMLNVVSGKVHQTYAITEDGRTISQLTTYCDMLVNDEIDPPDYDGCPGHGSPWFRYIYASFMLVKANLGLTIPAGMIPADVIQIAYKTSADEILPTDFELHQNCPNPFNPETEISFSLPLANQVKLEVFNIMGQSVATLVDDYLNAGQHVVRWLSRDDRGEPVPSGVYFYRLSTGQFTETKKMLLLK